MIELPIHLRRHSRSGSAAAAWYLATGDAAAWLAELARWPLDLSTVRIIPLGSPTAGQPGGALLIPPSPEAVNPSAHCVPFVKFEANLFLPADAQLSPPVLSQDVDKLLSPHYLYVWLPGAGLIAVEPERCLRVENLLWPPVRRSANWLRAVEGVAIPDRMASLSSAVELTLADIIRSSQDDISSDANSLSQLPPSPDESLLGGALMAGPAVALGLLAALGGAFRKLLCGGAALGSGSGATPGKGKRSKKAGKLGTLAAEKFATMAAALQKSRHRELARLLRTLERDPEEGLRHALPLTGNAFRGLAQPSGRLSERLVDFSLRRLGGGGAADFWDVPHEYRVQLVAKYREAANREIRLGRHRRAAYIFAELLGDFEAAAAALRDGRHYHESAVLYRDRLRRPLEAAKCLESGGLFAEAIEEYKKLHMHEKAGDLFTLLEQHDAAANEDHTAIEKCEENHNYLEVARLWEQKLDDVDQALVALEIGWNNSPQSHGCLRELFQVLGRIGRHEDAQTGRRSHG
jgi:hypothetical protein